MPDSFARPSQEIVVAFTGIPAHDRPQRRIGFQSGSIDGDCIPFQQALFGQHAQYPQENLAMRFHVDQTACSRDRRMIRC